MTIQQTIVNNEMNKNQHMLQDCCFYKQLGCIAFQSQQCMEGYFDKKVYGKLSIWSLHCSDMYL